MQLINLHSKQSQRNKQSLIHNLHRLHNNNLYINQSSIHNLHCKHSSRNLLFTSQLKFTLLFFTKISLLMTSAFNQHASNNFFFMKISFLLTQTSSKFNTILRTDIDLNIFQLNNNSFGLKKHSKVERFSM